MIGYTKINDQLNGNPTTGNWNVFLNASPGTNLAIDNDLFDDASITTFANSNTSITAQYTFSPNEGKRLINKIVIDWSLHNDNTIISFSKDGTNFTQVMTIADDKSKLAHLDFTTSDTVLDGTAIANNSDNTYIFEQPYEDPFFVQAIRINFQSVFFNTSNIAFRHIDFFEVKDPSAYYKHERDFEFDDALLDSHFWKNSRYEGSKLIGRTINEYSRDHHANVLQGNTISLAAVSSSGKFSSNPHATAGKGMFGIKGQYGKNVFGDKAWGGDISYGRNPVINNEVCAVYIGSTMISGQEDSKIVDINGHTFLNVDKFLLINPNTDEIEIIDRVNVDPSAFRNFVQTDFPEGSEVRFKLLDRAISTNHKAIHRCKFNQGNLMRLYTYTPNTDGFEDGVFGGFGVRGDNAPNSQYAGGSKPRPHQKGNLVLNLGSGSDASQSNDDAYPSSSHCGGLFGFGMTHPDSASLFTTNSISFVSVLPEELSQYSNEINTTTMGSILNPITSSFSVTTETTTTYGGGEFVSEDK